jgi:hypothetical protein
LPQSLRDRAPSKGKIAGAFRRVKGPSLAASLSWGMILTVPRHPQRTSQPSSPWFLRPSVTGSEVSVLTSKTKGIRREHLRLYGFGLRRTRERIRAANQPAVA